MDKQRFDRLTECGIDVDDALNRFMGNESLLERFLGKFTADKNYAELLQAAADRDADKMIAAAHTLKGVCGNLAMTELFSLLTEQVAHLRSGDIDCALELISDIKEKYEKIIASINN